jgi:hypothetical protein
MLSVPFFYFSGGICHERALTEREGGTTASGRRDNVEASAGLKIPAHYLKSPAKL